MKLIEKLHIFLKRLSSFHSYIKAFFIKKDSLVELEQADTLTNNVINDAKEISNTNDISVVGCKVRKVTVKKHAK